MLDIEMNVAINDKHIRLIDEQTTQVQLNKPFQVIIEGHVLNLTAEQKSHVVNYSYLLRKNLTELNNVWLEGVELAILRARIMAASVYDKHSLPYRELDARLMRIGTDARLSINLPNVLIKPQNIYTISNRSNNYVFTHVSSHLTSNKHLFSTAIMEGERGLLKQLKLIDVKPTTELTAQLDKLKLDNTLYQNNLRTVCQHMVDTELAETELHYIFSELADFNVLNIR